MNSQGLREDVSRLQVCIDVLQVDISSEDSLSNEMLVHLDVLGPSMEDWISSEVNTAHVVAVEGIWVRYRGRRRTLRLIICRLCSRPNRHRCTL